MADGQDAVTRRIFLGTIARAGGAAAIGGVIGVLLMERKAEGAEQWVWQIDPSKCTWCGKCATNCVTNPSAVRCFHAFGFCGYCELCTGFFDAKPNELTTAAENQLCPTGAIKRAYVEDPYFQYEIERAACIGCAKCVKGCNMFGNGSLYLQIDHSQCLHCNWCAIAAACPGEAISRMPAGKDKGYIANHIRTG